MMDIYPLSPVCGECGGCVGKRGCGHRQCEGGISIVHSQCGGGWDMCPLRFLCPAGYRAAARPDKLRVKPPPQSSRWDLAQQGALCQHGHQD